LEQLLRFGWSSDYFLLLLFLGGTNNTVRGNLECSKHDYFALEMKAKGVGAQVASLSSFQRDGGA